VDLTAVDGEFLLQFCLVDDLAARPGHVDASPKLIEPQRQRTHVGST
jgi:hypothetical protein